LFFAEWCEDGVHRTPSEVVPESLILTLESLDAQSRSAHTKSEIKLAVAGLLMTAATAFSKFFPAFGASGVTGRASKLWLFPHVRPSQMINMRKAQLNVRYGILEHGCKSETLAAWTGQLYRNLACPIYGRA
jgi:hypothetical protein